MGVGLWLGFQRTLATRGLVSTPHAVAPLTSNMSSIYLSPGGQYALGNSANLSALESLKQGKLIPEGISLGLHDSQTGQLLWRQQNLFVHLGCFSPEGSRFVARTYQKGTTFLAVHETLSGKRLWQSPKAQKLSDTETPGVLSAGGRFLLTTRGKELELWEVGQNQRITNFALAVPPGFSTTNLESLHYGRPLALSPDGQWAALKITAAPSPQSPHLQLRDVSFVSVWHVGQSQPVAFLPVNDSVYSLTFAPDSQTLYTSSASSVASMGWTGSSGCPIGAFNQFFTAQEHATTRDQFEELTAQIYAKRPQPEYGIVGTLQPIDNEFSTEERGFRGTYGNGATVAWSVADGKPRWVFYSPWLSPLALSPDGNKLAIRDDNGLTILAAKTGKTLHQALLGPKPLRTVKGSPYHFEFSADGKSLREDYLNGWRLTTRRWDLSRVPDAVP
jgi:WD40 repeat protein